MTQALPWVAIVDDDPFVLKALARLLRSRALEVRTFGSALEFLQTPPHDWPEVLIVDLQMPAMTGLELQNHLAREGIQIPTIVITAHNEPDMRDLCMAAGAGRFLVKPIQDTTLLQAIGEIRSGEFHRVQR
jgi:FixJ family two-component response regulator